MRTLDLEIREWLAQYLTGKITLQQFEERFVPASWDVNKLNNQLASELVGEIELRLAEYSNGHLTVEGLRKRLTLLLQDFPVEISFGCSVPEYICVTGSEARTLEQFAGIVLEAVSL